MRPGTIIPRDVVLLPDIVVDGDDTDVPRALRPTFDALWQALGYDRSPSYGADGAWTGKVY